MILTCCNEKHKIYKNGEVKLAQLPQFDDVKQMIWQKYSTTVACKNEEAVPGQKGYLQCSVV